MSALMSDVLEGKLKPGTANAAVNAGGKLLKVVEMKFRYGSPDAPLVLAAGPSEAQP